MIAIALLVDKQKNVRTDRARFRLSTLALLVVVLSNLVGLAISTPPAGAEPGKYFGIEVVDDETGRGVPLVELRTVSKVVYYTDSLGFAAIDDPALLGHKIYFDVKSHGYEYPADGFGSRGISLEAKGGSFAQIKIKRLNIAERLYRTTGEGIYEDSLLLGKPVPIEQALLNAQVTGQDSAQTAIYQNKIFSFWGDTGRQSYPLGNFGTSGATAELPGNGGLDPSVGINFHYFTGADGFSRSMVPEAPGLVRWLDALSVLPDEQGHERLVGRVSFMKTLDNCKQRQLLIYNDSKNVFETLCTIPIDAPLQPVNHTFRVKNAAGDFLYCGEDYPNIRMKADFAHFRDLASYEGFTCLRQGARYEKSGQNLDRDMSGKLIWSWKLNTPPLGRKQMAELLKAKKIKSEELWFHPLDLKTGKEIEMAASSVSYNDYRHKYIAICSQFFGKSSNLGEIWYSEADKPEGPWRSACKIVTHDRYSFYNPVHHAYFDQQGGRLIYFEGTYCTTFSRNSDPTPRYDYNQIMYRLDLADPRLKL